MKDCFTGSMPWDDFVDTFYPIRGERPPLPELKFNVPLPCEDDPTSDISYYTERGTVSDFCRAINESGVCPSMDWVNTENVCIDMNGTLSTKDPKSKRKVDASGMEKPASGKLPVKPDFTRMKVAAEFKLLPQDPVVDADPEWTPEQRKEQGYVHQTANAIHARGQATSYALHSFSYKPRTHVTSLVIMGRWARLLRYDHSGVVVTERFDWRANKGRLLADFLSRVEHANAREDGVDDSVGDVSAFNEEQLIEARKAMKEFSDGMLDVPIEDKAKLRSVKCWDDSQLDENGLPKSRTLIATEPLGVNYSIVGRYTTSFIGYDINTRCAYWVKDSWPIDRPGEFEKEGRIYERLVDAGVPHIAEVECAGEVRWEEDNMVQRTRTAEFVKADWAGLTANIHPLSHYRILFKDIGRPITKFGSTHQLVTALSHAIEAHSVAYNDADVLHRDISAGNVLINRKGEGMLIDWDLALIYDNSPSAVNKSANS
ncbi:hypothetical protein PENSPDRAFT_362900 [Peniophora sp. CONT]|nr:hypothetical protein PENSPDRAFT_362900 [Peniophora sp. CONT]